MRITSRSDLDALSRQNHIRERKIIKANKRNQFFDRSKKNKQTKLLFVLLNDSKNQNCGKKKRRESILHEKCFEVE